MYLSKESIINLFFQMNFLYSGEDIQKQGGTQFFSELKYFLALDEFVKSEQRPCDTRNKDDKQKFVANVGHFVQLSDPNADDSLDAKNFFDSFGQNRDFDVGSNFFSAGAVNKSLTSTTPLPFPSRHPQLLTCENGKISIADGAYERFANEQDYLFYQDRKKKTILPNKKALLFFWLNRNTSFTSKELLFNEFLNSLRNRYSQNMISALRWDEKDSVYTNIARNLSTSNDMSFVEKEDLIFDKKDSYQRKKYFETWLCLNTSGDDGFRTHCVDVCEQWLDKKMPGNQIGNLFRYKDYESYKREHIRITALKDFSSVSDNDQSGRPRTAINHYLNFLNKMPHTKKVDDDNFVKLLKQLEQEIEKNPERIDALKKILPLEEKNEKDTSGTHSFFYFDFSSFTPTQIIYYGVPGCGKSYEVNKVINAELDKYGVTDKEHHKVRCVFHPEYCNADFVGQIYPYVKPDNGGVEYRFKPGPFAEIVRRAYRNPAEPFFLIVEEINRGNAAAIFGEMFQLLDRIRPEDGPEELSGNIYNTGWSSYGVTNIDVNAYVRQKSTDNPEKIEYDDSIPYGDKIKFINNTAVRLPPNLSIYATMNTNDQNVFTMDNAFQRRFKSKMIRNVLDENSAQYKTEIDDTGVYWGDFRKWINEKILLPQTAVLKADDKCLGGWFITGEKINGVDKIKKEDFAEKVLKYLWDDVFKRNKSGEIFVKDDKVNSLSDLIDAFETSVRFESFEKIFKMNDVDKAKLQKQANT